YAGTYFPPLDNYGRPGFGSVLRQLTQSWKEKPHDVESTTENFMNALQRTESIVSSTKLEKTILDEAALNLLSMGDPINGGFGQAPKFPNAANLSFMLRYSKLSGIARFQEFVFKTLNKMANGGIYDHLGGGFHRYSTDSRWLVPHFEKMLYDNALLPIVYAEAYQITKDPRYLEVVNQTLQYVLREMTSSDGGFYSAQDADSEGEEGKFYVWRKNEIQEILGKDTDIFSLYFDVTDGGNFEGHTILHNSINTSTAAFQFGKTEQEVKEIIKKCSEKLFEIRSKRVPPGKDEKILTSWNALMISAFVKGFKISEQKRFLEAAEKCVNFIQEKLTKNGELLRTYKDGQAKLKAYLDDYAYFTNALLDLFETNPNKKYLELAIYYTDYLLEHFWDENEKNFFFTADNHEQLIIRTKNIYDLSLPSGNSVAANTFLRLYHLTQNNRYLDVSVKIMESLSTMAAENPFGFGQLLIVMYLYLKNPTEITLLNEENHEIYTNLTKRFLPESILVTIQKAEYLEDLKKYPFFAGKEYDKTKTKVFVCKNFTCSLPLYSLTEIEKLL
ncbi:MAG TPA: thioredoxin domain-containing protein, partial [Nitrosopumilaceae archaeon]|nr:thioredoxin domain-containing protein [Nitrosopumilaceae archaeon]